ncbi:MAG: KH domain-containing protein [Erysipelotrichaceae bacterium]|nr:KH domain-containing protein [Erysipelotrichaceae bacterium]
MNKYTAKNLNDALNNASKDKNVTIEELIYEVTEEKRGILGLGNSVTIEAYTLEDVKEFLFDYLGDFFTGIDNEIEIEITPVENGYKIMLDADNNASLIGHNGRTLHAINTVVRGAVNSNFKRKFNILIDINNYKENRYRKVKAMAIRIAKNVKRTKIDATLDPMPNDERKIIHQTLTNFDNIKTESEGEGRNRYLKIMYIEQKSN